jgi:hypothetical protein
MIYKFLPNNTLTNEPAQSIIKINDNGSETHIPFDPDNTDYQEYLKWVAEGNTPQPAEGTK